jgi:multidrug resistance efflux pump
MTIRSLAFLSMALAGLALTAAGCTRTSSGGEAPAGAHDPAREGDHDHAPGGSAAGGAIELPAAVRQNLGITFARAERRAVARTLRVPGRFELLPTARREHRAPVPGRVELLVHQFDAIDAGAPLYRIESPAWRDLQREIAEADGAVRRAQAEDASSGPLLAAHTRHRESLEASVALWARRVEQLEEIRAAGGGRADEWASAQASVTESRAELADVLEKTAELEARRTQVTAELVAARARLDLLFASAATLTGVPAADLVAPVGAIPRWRTIAEVEVRAASAGIVEEMNVTNGAWVDASAIVLSTIRPELVRFRGRALQSDLGRLRPGLPARIVPPAGGSLGREAPLEGEVVIGLAADPGERTIDLLVVPRSGAPWAVPGVSAFMEITLPRQDGAGVVEGGAGEEELAIPLAAVARDGLTPVIFRRDPRDEDRVIRLVADLGIDDGRWVIVKSGVTDGDEVVLDGVFQLMLASSETAQKGGHFHADGTFHEGGEE